MNEQRLRNVVRALRESTGPENFSMSSWATCCGTPACVIGHYAYRTDLQKAFTLTNHGDIYKIADPVPISTFSTNEPDITFAKHFDIALDESRNLFGCYGCGEAKTIEEAIAYIEDFIDKKLVIEEMIREDKQVEVTTK